MARRDTTARGVEVGGGVAAGTVGSMLGAAKLRDAYKHDYPRHYAAQAKSAEHTVASVAPKAGRLARSLSEGEPGFVHLAVGTAGGVAAAGAKKYRKHREGLTKSFGMPQRRQDKAIQAIDSADTTVRGFRAKVPTGMRAAQLANTKARQAISRENDRLQKAYDPDRRVQRRERVVEAGAGVGAVGAAHQSVRATQGARKLSATASSHAAARDRSFTRGRAHNEDVVHDTATHAYAMKVKHGKGVSGHALEATAHTAVGAQRSFQAGLESHTAALHAAHDATGLARRVRNLRAGAVGLGAGAYLAHRRAGEHVR